MITYSVTVQVPPEREKSWAEWMKSVHIPEVMKTGAFHGFLFMRSVANTEITEYVIQYYCVDEKVLDNYLNEFAPALRKDFAEQFPQITAVERKIFSTISKENY